MIFLLLVLTSYLLGSFPTAVWVGKIFHGIDIREHGSNNAGATNTFRVLGNSWGWIVLIIDISKGYVAATIPLFLTNFYLGFKDEVLIYQLIASFCVIVGHVFPVFANFRGGKGVATTLGIILAINLDTALISLAIFLIVFMLTSYVSLGAIIASVVFPFISFFAMKEDARIMIIFSILVALIVLFSHRKNINRLMRGEENKMNFFGRKA
jgi:glycerol-3-phosphate acyltransferase PlsY